MANDRQISVARQREPGSLVGVRVDKVRSSHFSKAIMNMKIRPLAKIAATTVLLGGALCWSATAGDVTAVWNMNCAACHGKDGKGHTMMGRKLEIKDLTDAKVQASFTDDQATKAIKDGVTENGQTKMKAFSDKLSADQIKDLVAQVRSFKPEK